MNHTCHHRGHGIRKCKVHVDSFALSKKVMFFEICFWPRSSPDVRGSGTRPLPPSRSHVRTLWSGPIDNLDLLRVRDLASGFRKLHVIFLGVLTPPPPQQPDKWRPLVKGGQIPGWVPLISFAVGVHVELLHQVPQLPQEGMVWGLRLPRFRHYPPLPRNTVFLDMTAGGGPASFIEGSLLRPRRSWRCWAGHSLVATWRCFERSTFAVDPNWRGIASWTRHREKQSWIKLQTHQSQAVT